MIRHCCDAEGQIEGMVHAITLHHDGVIVAKLPHTFVRAPNSDLTFGGFKLARFGWVDDRGHDVGQLDAQSISLNDEAAMRAARKMARPLFMVSFHSRRSMESATIPPPAWM